MRLPSAPHSLSPPPILTGDEITSAQDYRTRGSRFTDIAELIYILGLCLVVSVVVWAAFYALIFRKRARLWKSLVALLVMTLVVTIVGVPARVATFLTYWDQDTTTLKAVRTSLNQRLEALRADMDAQGRTLRADRGLPLFTREADVTAALESIRKQREDLRAFQIAADAELQRAREETLRLDVYEGEREQALQKIDQVLDPNSVTHRLFVLENQLLDKQEEAVNFLLEHRASWDFSGDSLAFNNRQSLDQMNAIMSDAYEIIPQIDILEGAGGEGVPRAAPPID